MKDFFGLAGVVVGFVLVAVALWWFLWGVSVFTAPVVGRGDVYREVNSKTTRLAAYNHFYDLCASVQIAEDNLDAQYALQKMKAGDQERVVTVIAGVQGTRARAIRQYNVDSQKDYTIAQFKDVGLPFQIPSGEYTGKEHTTCGV